MSDRQSGTRASVVDQKQQVALDDLLLQAHGPGLCHICGKPKVEIGLSICSYPHRRLPAGEINAGFVTWEPVE